MFEPLSSCSTSIKKGSCLDLPLSLCGSPMYFDGAHFVMSQGGAEEGKTT